MLRRDTFQVFGALLSHNMELFRIIMENGFFITCVKLSMML